MNYYKTLIVVCLIILDLQRCQNYSLQIHVNNDELLQNCLIKLTKMLFGIETVTFIVEDKYNLVFPIKMENPRIISVISKPLEISLTSYYSYNYVIFIENLNNLNETLRNLITYPVLTSARSKP